MLLTDVVVAEGSVLDSKNASRYHFAGSGFKFFGSDPEAAIAYMYQIAGIGMYSTILICNKL